MLRAVRDQQVFANGSGQAQRRHFIKIPWRPSGNPAGNRGSFQLRLGSRSSPSSSVRWSRMAIDQSFPVDVQRNIKFFIHHKNLQ
jgi:hypothetical protein